MSSESILRFLADARSGDFAALSSAAGDTEGRAPDPALRRAALATVLATQGVGATGRGPVLALAADGASRLVDEILAGRGDDTALRPVKPNGVDPLATRSWLAARQRDHRPALLVGPVAGFKQLVGPVERRGLRFRLPAGSTAIVVRNANAEPEDGLRSRLSDDLGLTPDRLRVAWEAEDVTTPFIARWDGASRFAIPHWVTAEIDAEGRLVVTDLANYGAPLRVETGASARLDENAFILP